MKGWYQDDKNKESIPSVFSIMGVRVDSGNCMYCGVQLWKYSSPDAYACKGCYMEQEKEKELYRQGLVDDVDLTGKKIKVLPGKAQRPKKVVKIEPEYNPIDEDDLPF